MAEARLPGRYGIVALSANTRTPFVEAMAADCATTRLVAVTSQFWIDNIAVDQPCDLALAL
jgi:hypothetical protein